STLSRLCPTSSDSACRTCARSTGVPPRTSIVRTAKIDVSRAAAYPPTPRARSASPTSTERIEGARRPSAGRAIVRRAGSTAERAVGLLRAATSDTSPPRPVPLQGRQLQRAEELDLVLELDAVGLEHPAARLRHDGEAVGRRRRVGVLDEVRVPRRDERA